MALAHAPTLKCDTTVIGIKNAETDYLPSSYEPISLEALAEETTKLSWNKLLQNRSNVSAFDRALVLWVAGLEVRVEQRVKKLRFPGRVSVRRRSRKQQRRSYEVAAGNQQRGGEACV